MPFSPAFPDGPRPWNWMLRNVTTSVAPATTLMPLVPATSTLATCPPPPSIVIALLIVTAPKPPGSRASISPPAAVFEMAPAKVLQGAVRLQGLASSPTPDTQVRVACANAGVTPETAKMETNKNAAATSIDLWSITLSPKCAVSKNLEHLS